MLRKLWEALQKSCETCTRIRLVLIVAVVALLVGGTLMVAPSRTTWVPLLLPSSNRR